VPEVWGIALGAVGRLRRRKYHRSCEVSHFAGGTAISAIDIVNGSGIIRGNRVLLSTTNTSYQAFNGEWAHDVD